MTAFDYHDFLGADTERTRVVWWI